MKHALSVGKSNPADAFAYARGTGGVSDYDKGLQHALGGSNKPNTPKVASEDTGSRNDYYNEMINRAADDYLNEWGGKDTAEAKEAWAAYGEQVDGIVEQRDAYNRAAMGGGVLFKQSLCKAFAPAMTSAVWNEEMSSTCRAEYIPL